MKKPTPFCSFGGYRRFCDAWWNDLIWYATGVHYALHVSDIYHWWQRWSLDWPGWCRDIYTYWHRARYGWAPRDTWSLDCYLNRVLAGSLAHLAEHSNGAPAAYGERETGDRGDGFVHAMDLGDADANFDRWATDLRKAALAFSEDPHDVDIYDAADGYVRHRAEEERRRANLKVALLWVAEWWEALWD